MCTHSLEEFCLCEDIQTDCGGEDIAPSHDQSRHSLGLDISLPSSLNRGRLDLDDSNNELNHRSNKYEEWVIGQT